MEKNLYLSALKKGIDKYFGNLSATSRDALAQKMEWKEVLSGKVVIEAGEPSDGMYLLLSGRLSVYQEQENGVSQLVGSVFRGESVGEMGLLTDSLRSATVVASRDSILVKISRKDFQEISEAHPGILREFSKTLVNRLQDANAHIVRQLRPNITFLPLHEITGFSSWLQKVTEVTQRLEPAQKIDQTLAARSLQMEEEQVGTEASMEAVNRWLAEMDGRDQYTIYEADVELTPWTRKCARQADILYLVVDPRISQINEELLAHLEERKERHPEVPFRLLFLHEEGTDMPQNTHSWLERIGPSQYHHLRQDHERDYRRLARFLTRRTIGLACGGGGAKGIAHIGAVKAFSELGLEIDMYGGTSMGAILTSTQALDWSQEKLTRIAHKTFVEGSISNDYQLPLHSLLKGRKKEVTLQTHFDYQIEDLWYNFFCVSCDLSVNQQKIHDRGSLWEAITASSAMPGVFPPMIQDGHFLVDGALINNLPGDLLKDRGARFLVNIDVMSVREIFTEADHFPSAWKALRNKILPGKKKRVRFPGLFQIYMRSSYIPSVKHSKEVSALADITLEPPVRKIGLMGWEKMDEAIRIGYESTMTYFEEHPEALQQWKDMQGPMR